MNLNHLLPWVVLEQTGPFHTWRKTQSCIDENIFFQMEWGRGRASAQSMSTVLRHTHTQLHLLDTLKQIYGKSYVVYHLNMDHLRTKCRLFRSIFLLTLFTLSALLPTTMEQPQVCRWELMALRQDRHIAWEVGFSSCVVSYWFVSFETQRWFWQWLSHIIASMLDTCTQQHSIVYDVIHKKDCSFIQLVRIYNNSLVYETGCELSRGFDHATLQYICNRSLKYSYLWRKSSWQLSPMSSSFKTVSLIYLNSIQNWKEKV